MEIVGTVGKTPFKTIMNPVGSSIKKREGGIRELLIYVLFNLYNQCFYLIFILFSLIIYFLIHIFFEKRNVSTFV